MWHLEANSRVVIDLPKIEEGLWPGAPAVFASGPGPLAGRSRWRCPRRRAAARARTRSKRPAAAFPRPPHRGRRGRRPGEHPSKMGQRPSDLAAQLRGCAALTAVVGADAGKALGAAQARALPVLVRLLRLYGHHADAQVAAWGTLVHLVEPQPFLRKPLADLEALRLALSGIDAHKRDEAVLAAIATRLLRPAAAARLCRPAASSCSSRPSTSTRRRRRSPRWRGCLKLAGVSNIVRRMSRMEALMPLRALCGRARRGGLSTRSSSPSRGALPRRRSMQPAADDSTGAGGRARLAARFGGDAALQADAARVLAALLSSERAVLAFVAAGGTEAPWARSRRTAKTRRSVRRR